MKDCSALQRFGETILPSMERYLTTFLLYQHAQYETAFFVSHLPHDILFLLRQKTQLRYLCHFITRRLHHAFSFLDHCHGTLYQKRHEVHLTLHIFFEQNSTNLQAFVNAYQEEVLLVLLEEMRRKVEGMGCRSEPLVLFFKEVPSLYGCFFDQTQGEVGKLPLFYIHHLCDLIKTAMPSFQVQEANGWFLRFSLKCE